LLLAVALGGPAPAIGMANATGVLLGSLASDPSTGAATTRYQGRRLAEVLLALQGQGLTIVFTSELVRPEMKVVAEPAAREPRRILDEILAPHGLRVQEAAGGVLVIVAKTKQVDREASIEGAVLHPQPYVRDEIVVRPSRLALLDEQADSSFSLSREEIESLPQLGGDILRTTSLLPGVAANDVTAQFSVHGGRRDEVGILLDGQELYGTFHLKDYDNALSLVPARILSTASLTTGAYPASQGDRMSGVLDLRTLDPAPSPQVVLGLSVLDVMASSSGRFADDRGAWLVSGRRGSIALAGDVIGNEDPWFWDFLGKAELATDLGRMSAHLLLAGDRLTVDQAGPDGIERLDNAYQSTYGWLTHQATLGERLLVETIGSWAQVETDRSGSGSDEESAYELHDRRELEVMALSQTWSLQLGPRHLARWGWEARRYDTFFDYAKAIEPEVVIIAPFSPPRPTAHQFEGSLVGDHIGLWASDRVSLLDRLTAELGLRYDRHTASDDTLLSPRVNLAWRLGERSVVRAAWGRFFQSQRPYELQVEDGDSTLYPAERSEHWVLGYERHMGPNRFGVDAVRVELFGREVEDPRPRYESLLEPLNFFPEIEPDRVRIAPERSSARGLEILMRGSGGSRFDWLLAYSYARTEDRLDGEAVPRALDQPNTLAIDLHGRLPQRWDLNLAWRYHTGWPTTPVETGFVDDPEDPDGEPKLVGVFGPLRSERFPVYHRLDLRASRRWDIGSGRLTFFADIQNLYNRRNRSGFTVSLDQDAEVVRLQPEQWPGIFPSFGITWEF
jgi:outer membrane receptor protein involved in Fe transport